MTGGFYQVSVLSTPPVVVLTTGENLLRIGYYFGEQAYFNLDQLAPDAEPPVLEWSDEGLVEIAESFEEWLFKRCNDARNFYSAKEWKQILNGSQPFTAEEQRIVDARPQFEWHVIGFNENQDLMIEVTNHSELVLPYL